MASNIRVTLEVDNKKYLKGIKDAESATGSFASTTNTNTTALSNSFNKLGASTTGLVSKLNGIKTILAGLITVEALRSANEYANAVKDIAVTADLSIESVIGLGKAFETNGGSAEGARNAILKFGETIGDAIAGSATAQKALQAVGVSLGDIQSKGNEELFKQSIDSLGKMENASMRLKAQMDVMGKGAKGVSFPGVATDFGPAAQEAAKYKSAIEAGSAASENLKKNLGNLTQALLNVAEPLNKIVSATTVTVTAFESLFKIIAAAGAAFLIFGKVIPAVHALVGGLGAAITAGGGIIALFTSAIMGMVYGLINAVKNFGRFIGVLASGQAATASLIFGLKGILVLLLRFAGIAGIIYAVVEAVDALSKAFLNFSPIDYLIEKFDILLKKSKEFFGMNQNPSGNSKAGAGRGDSAESVAAQIAQGEKLRKEYDARIAKEEEFKKRQSELRGEILKIGEAYDKNNSKLNSATALERRLVGASEDKQESARAEAAGWERMYDAIDSLVEKRKEWAKGTPEQQASLGIIDAEIAAIKKRGEAQNENIREYIDMLQGARLVEKGRLADIENMTKAMEEQAKRQEALAGIRLGMGAAMQDVKFAGAQAGKSPFAQQAALIVEDARKAALEAGRAFSAAFEDTGDGLTPARAQELADGLAAIAEGYKGISDEQMKNLEASRTWSAGWEEAFAVYKDAAQNAAEQSKTYFETFTKGMEDVFVSFVRTGKLSFKDLANSLIADFARIQAKKAIAGLFDMGGGGSEGGFSMGSMMGGIGKIFGFANGGNPAMGKPAIVGENGPEWLVPRNAVSVIPNGAMGGGSSITNVTYSIQATDAASFQQLLARDPGFLHAVAEKGRRNLPQGARR